MTVVLGALIAAVVGLLTAFAANKSQRRTNDDNLKAQSGRLLNERFATGAQMLGDEHPGVQLAGVYALASLADDWEGQRQTCINVLCAYLMLPQQQLWIGHMKALGPCRRTGKCATQSSK